MSWSQCPWQRKAIEVSRLSVLCVLAALLSGFAYGLTFSEPAPNRGLRQLPEEPALLVPGLGEKRGKAIAATIDGAAEACAPIDDLIAVAPPRDTPERAQLSRLLATLSHSPLARRLIEQAQRRHAVICIDAGTELLAYYRAGLRLIGLRSSLSEGEKIAYLAHELTHVPQHHRYSDNRYFPATDLILLRRVREANAEAVASWIAWELRAAGFPAAWREKRADRFYGDIARAFEQAWTNLSGPNRGICAARAAFDQWFADPRRLDLYDRMTIDHLERIAGDPMGLVSPSLALTHGFLAEIGRLGTHNFLTDVPGRWLTHAHYTDGISEGNAKRLDNLLVVAAASRAGPNAPWVKGEMLRTAQLAGSHGARLSPRGRLPGLIR